MSSLLTRIQRQAPAQLTDELTVPRTFLGFLAWLGVTPRPGQAELARVAFDGAMPVDVPLAETIFGKLDWSKLTPQIRRVVVAVVGGRGGKTYLLIALRLVWGMLVRDLSVLAPGEEAFATVVAPNDKLRQQAINYALGACRSKPELKALLRLPKGTKDNAVVSEFGIYRADFDRVVTFRGACATSGGYDVRGKWHTDLALDECAFFRDSTAKVNDKDIYEAGIARVLPGGQCILGSTPWAQVGLLYEFWRDNYGKPTTALVAHAPTLVLSDLAATIEVVESETRRNPDNARREYGAEFMATGTTVFFDAASIEGAISEEPFTLQPGDDIRAGGDFAFLGDSSALVLVARRGDVLHVYDGAEERPTKNEPLRPSVTVDVFAKAIAGRCRYLMADAHYRASIEEHLQHYGLEFAPAPTIPSDAYVRSRMLMREIGRVVIHPMPMRDRLIQQLREVHARPTAGGRLAMHNPRWSEGGHGDIASAFVLALWQVSGDEVQGVEPEPGTREWEAKRREQRQRRMIDDTTGPADRGKRAFWRK